VLVRIDTMSAHGASNTSKAIALTADMYSFIFWNLGVMPKY
jgi:prolyl oligopeptidase